MTDILDVCCNCGKIVRINKRFFGGLHICTTPQERREYANAIIEIAARNRLVMKANNINMEG